MGGDNSESNKIFLTFKEHYICHRLLCKMVDDKALINKMKYALYCLTRSNSKQYRDLSFHQKMIGLQANREASKNRNHKPNLGNKHSPETIQKIRQSLLGKKHSQETIQKLIDCNIKNKEIRSKNVSKAMKGKIKSTEHKMKLSLAAKEQWKRKKMVGHQGIEPCHAAV